IGLETLHQEWKQWKYDDEHPLRMEGRGGGYGALIAEREKHKTTYFEDLKRLNFPGNQAFENGMEKKRITFRDQTVRFAVDQLNLYEHMLFTEKKKLENQGGGAQIAKGIAEQHASEHFKTANVMESYGMMSRTTSRGQAPKTKADELLATDVD